PNDTWPSKSAKHSVPAVIDVPALNEIVRCSSFVTGDLKVTMSAVHRLIDDFGLKPISPEALMAGFEALKTANPRLFRTGPDGTALSAQLGKKGFRELCGLLFEAGSKQEMAAARLYDVIDIDYDHAITTAEALMGLSLFCPGDGKLRAELVFDIFDVDGNGVLDREEMHDMLRTVGLRGVHMIENLFDPYLDPNDVGMAVNFEAVRHYDEIEQDAELAVARADVNDDGHVTREEYLAWIEDHAVMRQYIEIPNLLFGAVR
ncbi:MAG: EF-hand domain-containing protein, partial [Alphaproteobacteria bacterium]